jgi:hypothetical protein
MHCDHETYKVIATAICMIAYKRGFRKQSNLHQHVPCRGQLLARISDHVYYSEDEYLSLPEVGVAGTVSPCMIT